MAPEYWQIPNKKEKMEAECPACGSKNVTSHGKRYAVYPYGLVAVLGLLLAIFHQSSRPNQYKCNDCGEHFARRAPLGRLCMGLFVLGVVLSGLLILMVIAMVILGG